MNNYIFSFAHIDKEKYIELKNSFLENPLSDYYNIVFLTKKNFDSFFNYKFKSIKCLLFGNNLLFLPKKSKEVNTPLLSVKEDLTQIDVFLNKLEFQFKLFVIICKNNYYFPDFLLESEKYNNRSIYNLIINNDRNRNISILNLESRLYKLLLIRINNLKNVSKNDNFVSYMY